MPHSLEIIDFLGLIPINPRSFEVYAARTIFDAQPNSLSFIYRSDTALLLRLKDFGQNSLIILGEHLKADYENIPHVYEAGPVIVYSHQPKQDFVRIIKQFFIPPSPKPGIHPSAQINPSAKIDSSVSIGANCVIGNCEIKPNSIIENNVIVSDKTIIGQNVKIRPLCYIGAEDFGPVRREDESVEMFPQIGFVKIEDNVEIFAGTIIGRGTLAATLIGKGVKIDAMCQIGHNCTIGENVVITANSFILGSVTIGKNSYIGSGSLIRNECSIGENVVIGMGSVVTKSLPDNVVAYGNPAVVIKENPHPFRF